MRSVIALCGYKRSGKDTVADILVKHAGYKKLSIAGPLKDACKLLFGFTDEQLTTDLKDVPNKEWNEFTPRQVMQFFGTEMMQFKLAEFMPFVGRSFWIMQIIRKIQCETKVVIPDLRFRHEYAALRRAFGSDLKVVSVIGRNASCSDIHVSEQEWLTIDADITIENTGGLKELEELVFRQMI